MSIQDVRAGLRAFLLADAAISSAVGSDRIYALRIPQGKTAPCIVITRISGLGDHHMQGASGLSRPRVQIDCYALSPDVAGALANLVKGRLDGYRGPMTYGSSSPQAQVEVQGVFFDSEREFYEDDTKFYRVSHDYLIWYEEI